MKKKDWWSAQAINYFDLFFGYAIFGRQIFCVGIVNAPLIHLATKASMRRRVGVGGAILLR